MRFNLACRFIWCSALVIGCAWPLAASAQSLPVARLFSVFPAGGKQGATVEVTIGGADLEGVSKLLFSDPGITAVQKTVPPGLGQTGPQGVPGQFTLTIAPDAKPGLCEVRAVGKYGVSNPRAFMIGTRDEIAEVEPNNAPDKATEVQLGTVVNGMSNAAADQDFFKFTAKAGQRVIIDCWAYRIDSRMDATLVLYDASGKELARNRDTNRRDPLLDFIVPADGVYFVEVHDFLYAGNSEYFYRLAIGADAYLDFVLPPAGLPGSNDSYTLFGRNLPGGEKTELLAADGKPLEKLTVQIPLPADGSLEKLDLATVVEPDESGIDGLAYRLTTPQGQSNAVLVGFATAPIVMEQEPNDQPAQPQKVSVPCEVVGQFYPQTDRDWISFEAKAGESLWIEVLSQRLGLPTDPLVLVQQVTKNDKGEEQVKDLQAVDDFLENPPGNMYIYEMKTDDPAFRFTAPADGTYRILVRNQASYTRPNPALVYRLMIRGVSPDFRLVAKPRLLPFSADPNQNPPTVWSPLLRKGGTEIFDVLVFRRDGFDGEVRVSVEGLPPGVTANPVTIGPGQNLGALVVSAAEDAAEATALVTVVGKAQIAGSEITRPARSATMVWGGQLNQVTPRSRLTRNLAVAVSGGETAPFLVQAGATELEMSKAGKVQVPVKLLRRGEFKGSVALAPSPLPPNVKPPALTLDDKTSEGSLQIDLPANVPPGTYTFALLGTSQVSYARNPEAVKEATDRKAAVDKIVAERTEAVKAATEAKAAAEKQATDLTAAMQKARELAAAADKAAQEAAAKARAAEEAKQAALKAAAEAEAQAKAAADAKAAAEKTAAEADAKVKEATAVQQAVAKEVEEATKRAKPANVNVAAASPTVTLKVTPAPLTLGVQPATAKPGTAVEVPLAVNRLYGFADAVTVKVTPPADQKELKVADVTIAAGQTQAPLKIEVGGGVQPGSYRLQVQATAKFNGQDLPVTETLTLTVEPAGQ